MITDLPTTNNNHLINTSNIIQEHKNYAYIANKNNITSDIPYKLDPNYYIYLILDTILKIKIDHYLSFELEEFNEHDFGSHAKLGGFANIIIKKISKKLESTLFKIKDSATKLNILQHLYNHFKNNLLEYENFYLAIEDFGTLKFPNINEALKKNDSINSTSKIKLYYFNYFKILATLFQNAISLEHISASFEESNPEFSNIWQLFIEKNLHSQGRLYFENEQGYMVSSMRGLAYAMNKFEYEKHIDHTFLEEISEIIGGNKRTDITSTINLTYNHDPNTLRNLLSRSYYTGEHWAIKMIEIILNCKVDAISRKYSLYNKNNTDDIEKIYVLDFYFTPTYPAIAIKYIGDITKKEYVNILFQAYYQQINEAETPDLKFIVYTSINLCKELQYLHPLGDATGRTFLFILLPLLLRHHRYWLNSLPESIWDILYTSSEEMTERILPLCCTVPAMTTPINWRLSMTTLDKIFLCCNTGNLTQLLEIINNDYQLTEKNIPLVNISPIEIALINTNYKIFLHLLANNSVDFLHKKKSSILPYLKKFNKNLYAILVQYFTEIINQDTKAKTNFLKDICL